MTPEIIRFQIDTYGPRIRAAYGYDYWQGWVSAMEWTLRQLEASE